MNVPLRGEFLASVDYAGAPENKIRWNMDSGEHVPAAGPEEWREAFQLLGKALWTSTPGTKPIPWDKERVEYTTDEKVRVISPVSTGQEVVLELEQLDTDYYRTVRISVTSDGNKGHRGPDQSDLELLLLFQECPRL